MSETKAFGIGAILSITGEAMMCDIGDIYELLGWMTRESLMTHQLPRASRECEGFLRETFPDLAATEVPAWSETAGWNALDNDGKMGRHHGMAGHIAGRTDTRSPPATRGRSHLHRPVLRASDDAPRHADHRR